MDTERREFLKRIEKIRSKIDNIKRQHNGEPPKDISDDIVVNPRILRTGDPPAAYKNWQATISVNGQKTPVSNATFTIKAENKGSEVLKEDIEHLKLVGASEQSISEFIEEASNNDEDNKPYPYAVTIRASK